jgi:omega-amidase
MMDISTFSLSLVQSNLTWENPQANREHFSQHLDSLQETTHLIVLPETFTTGFSMQTTQLAEPMEGPTLRWMADWAARKNAVVTGSFLVKETDRFFNRMIWMQPDGQYRYYNKRHLFRMSGEDTYFSPGREVVTVEYLGWRFRLNICYDLRFPVWARNRNDYDVLLNIANWPASRREVWECLLQARALENQAYVVGVNRIGTDGYNTPFSGNSVAFDAKGQIIGQIPSNEESILSLHLDASSLLDFRERFPAWKDADSFEWMT